MPVRHEVKRLLGDQAYRSFAIFGSEKKWAVSDNFPALSATRIVACRRSHDGERRGR